MAFHESRVVIIETGRRVVRAGLGLGELLHVPSVVRSAYTQCFARAQPLEPYLPRKYQPELVSKERV